MDIKKTGRLIAGRRREKGLSQAELAAMLHVTDKAVSRWETGRGMPALELLRPLAGTLDLTVDDLLGGAPPVGAEHRPEHRPILWPCCLFAALLMSGLPAGVLALRIVLNPGPVEILLPAVIIGAAAGILLCGVLFWRKKPLLPCAGALLILWFILPGNGAASALLGCGWVCCIAAIPGAARRLRVYFQAGC